METQKKIAVIHDLSGYGRCSLTVALPILSAMGHQCCPLPTAILSNHTEFPIYHYRDLTQDMQEYADIWIRLGLSFDAILTGFFSSAAQAQIAESVVAKLRNSETTLIVDPVMADNGKYYATCGDELCQAFKMLLSQADYALPNLTEACLLTGTPYKENGWRRQELLQLALKLRMMGVKNVIITGVREGGFLTNVVLRQGRETADFLRQKITGGSRPGTGDVFASVFAGALLEEEGPEAAVRLAAGFVKECIRITDDAEVPHANGVCFEKILGKLTGRGAY